MQLHRVPKGILDAGGRKAHGRTCVASCWQVARQQRMFGKTQHGYRNVGCVLMLSTEENGSKACTPEDVENDGRIMNDVIALALPTTLALAVEPIGSLVSTGFMGHIGSVELAGVGVSLSVYNSFTKLFNMPLLAIITSTIASALGQRADDKDTVPGAIVSSLFLALIVGVIQTLVLLTFGRFGLSIYGAQSGSEIFQPAAQYLMVRTLGNCATVMFVSLLGIFRGLGDTVSPLVATLCFTCSSIIFEYLFLFSFGWGAFGAATAVVLAQLIGCCIQSAYLIRSNHISFRANMRKVETRNRETILSMKTYKTIVESLGLTWILMCRTLAVMLVYATACGILARFGGATVTAAHQIAFQIWLASSLLSDSLAVASQSLISRVLGRNKRDQAKAIASVCFRLAIALGFILMCALTLASFTVPRNLFTTNRDVLMALSSIMPMVIGSQVVNSIAFVMDGIVYGYGRDGFLFAAKSMILSAIPSIATMLIGLHYCLNKNLGSIYILQCVWIGLLVLMVSRSLTMNYTLLS